MLWRENSSISILILAFLFGHDHLSTFFTSTMVKPWQEGKFVKKILSMVDYSKLTGVNSAVTTPREKQPWCWRQTPATTTIQYNTSIIDRPPSDLKILLTSIYKRARR
ncbi:hypothetical protein CEXT_379061 [Caerostris extrusa]|uniref:Secreted protein n=1 Tax=Caerostris extrusa TaxID=172846 RepID=A0AAV4P151_CAEEX|nr:hypothetical protein CEXT_379061 [Caerostris extrusa]